MKFRGFSVGRLMVIPFVLGAFMISEVPQVQAADIDLDQALSFQATKDNWQRRSNTGSLARSYDVKVIETFANDGPRLVNPKPGDLFFYENTGRLARRAPKDAESGAKSGVIVVIDAATKKVIASNELAPELNGSMHSTQVSPDGKWVYIIGPTQSKSVTKIENGQEVKKDVAVHTLIKVDALTLQPVALLDIGVRLHHAHVWQDKYVLMEAFGMNINEGGLHVFLFDPATDKIVGGLSADDLGANLTHAFPGPKHEFIYALMTAKTFGRPSSPLKATSAYRAMHDVRAGDTRWLPQPFWVNKIDPRDWSVVKEYPYAAVRADWIQFSGDGKSMYLNGSGDDKVVKMDLATGNQVWGSPVGPGPYAVEINADDTEVWIADKGEASHQGGRTITVVGAEKGNFIATLPSVYQVDHIILSPDGTEMWTTSNAEGLVMVWNIKSKKMIERIEMPGRGTTHGGVFVLYDENGGRVVADQGDFHGGIDPRNGKPLRRGFRLTAN